MSCGDSKAEVVSTAGAGVILRRVYLHVWVVDAGRELGPQQDRTPTHGPSMGQFGLPVCMVAGLQNVLHLSGGHTSRCYDPDSEVGWPHFHFTLLVKADTESCLASQGWHLNFTCARGH